MKLSQIEYFLAASEKLNFTAAAKSLFISQPALSKQIKLIEDELDTKLFTRSKKRVTLTEAGISLRNDLEGILKSLDNALEKARSAGRKKSLKIGCFQGVAIEDLIYTLSEKSKQMSPETEVIFLRSGFKEIREALINGSVDMILTLDFELTELHSYCSQKMLTARIAFVYSEKSILTKKEFICLDDFSGMPLLILSPEISKGAYHNAVSLMKDLGMNDQRVEIYDSWETLLTYLKMGRVFTALFENASNKMNGLVQYALPNGEFFGSVAAVWKNENTLIKNLIDNY